MQLFWPPSCPAPLRAALYGFGGQAEFHSPQGLTDVQSHNEKVDRKVVDTDIPGKPVKVVSALILFFVSGELKWTSEANKFSSQDQLDTTES